jgi:NAD(P)-dependent dehydrogenase (short-subunit alcohol dehydrogenase family)
LDGKVAVITGATSGMALASAKLFVEEGAYVFITGRRQENLDEAVKEIGLNVTGVQADSAMLSALDRLYEAVTQEKGHVDIVFASAGHGGRAPLGTITEEQFDSLFTLNTRGTLFTVQKALRLMRDGGSIIMNGSIAHLKGMPGLGVYGGSKAALRSFARSWAVELAERRIRVNVLSTGPIDTNAMAGLPPDAKEYFRSGIPRKELGRSKEIATAALFLASDDSSFVNGSELCVDGGMAQI